MSATPSPADQALTRAEWQPVLFAERPRRGDLARLDPAALGALPTVRVHVLRNHAFEYVASALAPYAAFAGYSPAFTYSDYDDALSTLTSDGAEVVVVWLDFVRYHGRFEGPEPLADWLLSRLHALRAVFDGPVLVADQPALSPTADAWAGALNAALASRLSAVPGAHLCPLSSVTEALGSAAADARSAAIGSRLSDRAFVLCARALGLQWLPASVAPRVKALALDLDHTLYQGVLGEDGVKGVVLTEGHRALQEKLVGLQRSGVFLAVVSRNEPDDALNLFAERGDFPLRPEHISAWGVSWNPKSQGIRDALGTLRIGVDAVVLLDDNPGELAAAAMALPGLRTLHASPDPALTLAALGQCPGLFAWRVSAEDGLRAKDLAATETRKILESAAGDREEYLRSLGIRLEFNVPAGDELARAHELSNKTNQFNLALARFSEAEVGRRAGSPDAGMVTVALRDRLSDSGVIALVSAVREGDDLLVDELCISCRALGRDLEDVIVGEAVSHLARTMGTRRVGFAWAAGPRNGPALAWAKKYVSGAADEISEGGGATNDRPRGVVWLPGVPTVPPLPVTVAWRE